MSNVLADALTTLQRLQNEGMAIAKASLSPPKSARCWWLTGFCVKPSQGGLSANRLKHVPGTPPPWSWLTGPWWAVTLTSDLARLGAWCLAPSQALKVYGKDYTVPKQLMVWATQGNNRPVAIEPGFSLFVQKKACDFDIQVDTRKAVRIPSPEPLLSLLPVNEYEQADQQPALAWLFQQANVEKMLQ